MASVLCISVYFLCLWHTCGAEKTWVPYMCERLQAYDVWTIQSQHDELSGHIKSHGADWESHWQPWKPQDMWCHVVNHLVWSDVMANSDKLSFRFTIFVVIRGQSWQCEPFSVMSADDPDLSQLLRLMSFGSFNFRQLSSNVEGWRTRDSVNISWGGSCSKHYTSFSKYAVYEHSSNLFLRV